MKCNVQLPRVRALKCDHARNRNLCSAAMWTFCISMSHFEKSMKPIKCSHLYEGRSNMVTIHVLQYGTRTTDTIDDVWINIVGSNVFWLKHATRQAEKQTLRKSVQLQRTLAGRQWTDRICFPLSLHLSLLFLNTSPFLFIPTSRFRKLEIQERIVTAGRLPPPLTPLTQTRMGDFSAATITGK